MDIESFTYEGYKTLVNLLRDSGYSFCTYSESTAHDSSPKCILRHDVDFSIDRALSFAEFENSLAVKATFFILLKTDFYNPFSRSSINMIKRICSLGHCIGLHFDEKAYQNYDNDKMPSLIAREANILSDLLGMPIGCVSMHRPSAGTLEADYKIDGIENSYSQKYFKNFKYVSDSRRRWREDAKSIILSGKYAKLQILTHPFWYHDNISDIKTDLLSFVIDAQLDRYKALKENLTNLDDIVKIEELR